MLNPANDQEDNEFVGSDNIHMELLNMNRAITSVMTHVMCRCASDNMDRKTVVTESAPVMQYYCPKIYFEITAKIENPCT